MILSYKASDSLQVIVRTESVEDTTAAGTVPCRKKVVNKKLNLKVSSHTRAGVSFLSVEEHLCSKEA